MQSIEKLLKKKAPVIMGILNTTPDSFSDGGKHHTPQKALKKALEMIEAGAQIIDIGGESTGPGSKNVTTEEELRRVIPVIKLIRKHSKVLISIDTYKSAVAKEALANGADIINDVTALRGDKEMASVIAESKCPYIMMYSKDPTARTTLKAKTYADVTKTIEKFFEAQIKKAQKNGIKRSQLILDPGMGQFISSIPKYSFQIIARLPELKNFKLPILIGISRKSFFGGSLKERDEKGKALTAIAYLNGASIIRTHDVKGIKEFFKFLKWN